MDDSKWWPIDWEGERYNGWLRLTIGKRTVEVIEQPKKRVRYVVDPDLHDTYVPLRDAETLLELRCILTQIAMENSDEEH